MTAAAILILACAFALVHSSRFAPHPLPAKLHVHIGHHIYGAGNLGDDLMLAGFLAAARPAWLPGVRLTCCIPYDLACQRRRFPEIEWLPYDPGTRAACIRASDVWLGLGDTPFQATGGHTWFLDHLCEEAAWCRQFGVPMFYLGVGVNERATVDLPQTRALVAQAERLWLRDDETVAMLRPLTIAGQATAHGDLAHLALADMRFPPPEPDALGLVLNFEDPTQFHVEQLAALVRAALDDGWRVRWLAQEIRALPGSETILHAGLPPEMRAGAPLQIPDYAGAATARALWSAWEGVGAFFTSRYHASLVGAWTGARGAVFARSDKVAGAARQLGLPVVPRVGNALAILRAVAGAVPVERHRLLDLAARTREACEEFFSLARVRPGPPPPAVAALLLGDPSRAPEFSLMPPPSPTRILFLHPDAYGDLVLFEPVPRLVRAAWPQAEVAVLIRQPYADAAPLLASEGVRWLTTDCNPYREGPGDRPAALAALRETVRAFAPDCVVAACAEQTWLEAAVAAFLPGVRQVSLGQGLTDPLARAALDAVLPVDWAAIYPEKILVAPEQPEWEKNLRLASALTGRDAPRWWPVATVPADAQAQAARIVADAGLIPGEFVVCAAAGTANVPLKHWPAAPYGETLAWLEREHGIRALLIGHVSEGGHLEIVRESARHGGGTPALWVGQDGEMPIVAGLLATARFYFGNDTGALHLAGALGRPVVPIFGGGTWPRFAPVARRSLTVVQPLPCFGCAWDCYFADAPCVRTISPGSVRQALEQFLSDDAEGQHVFEAEGLDPGARALIHAATPRLRFQREDSHTRLLQTRELTALLHLSEADRDSRLRQVDELTAQLHLSEADRDARLLQVNELTAELRLSEADRAAREAQVAELTALLKTSEADRDARGKQVAELTPLLQASETDRDARQRQVAELTALLKTSEADRDARARQIDELTAWLTTSETDRLARGKQIDELTAWLLASNADRDALSRRIAELTARLETAATRPEPPTPDAMGPTDPAASDEQEEPELTATPVPDLPALTPSGTAARRPREGNFS